MNSDKNEALTFLKNLPSHVVHHLPVKVLTVDGPLQVLSIYTTAEGLVVDVEGVAPAAWNGPEDGLPPVGMTVERKVGYDGWQVTTICGHSPDGKSFAAFYDNELAGWSSVFRPIRTAEQLAAEEREEAIREMNRVARSGTKPYLASTGMGGGCEALYDAGYRLVKP